MHLFLLLLFACTTHRDPSAPEPRFRHGIVPSPLRIKTTQSKLDVEAQRRGKILYEGHCLSCHGERGEGNGPLAAEQKFRPANLRKLVDEVRNFTFYMSVSVWEGEMPGWKEPLTSHERDDLVAYIKTFR